MKQRIFSLFTALCLCLTLLPTAALANDNPTGDPTQTDPAGSLIGEGIAYKNWINGAFVDTTHIGGSVVVASKTDVTWSGWYVVSDNVTVSGTLTVNGDVHLILCDGAHLTINGGINKSGTGQLTVYGQSAGTGKLTVTGAVESNGDKTGVYLETLTINGGEVSVTCDDNEAVSSSTLNRGIHLTGTSEALTVRGGKLTATGGAVPGGGQSYGIYNAGGGALTVTGGELIAKGGTVGKTDASNADLSDDGGENYVAQSGYSYGIYNTRGITVSGGKLTATGGTVEITAGTANSCGVYSSLVTVTGGEVNATGGTVKVKSESAGSYGINNDNSGTFAVSGGTVNATSGEAVNKGGVGGVGESRAVFAGYGNIAVSGGTVNTQTGSVLADVPYVFDINTYGDDIAITGGTVQKKGSTGGAVVVSGKNVTVMGGTIKLAAGSSASKFAASSFEALNALIDTDCVYYEEYSYYDSDAGGYVEVTRQLDGTKVGYESEPAGRSVSSEDGAIYVRAVGADDLQPVSYLDAQGKTQTCVLYEVLSDYVDENSNDFTVGEQRTDRWYVVKKDLTVNGKMNIEAYYAGLHLILCDGATLTVAGISGNNDNSMTIYGQSGGTGKLVSVDAASEDGRGISVSSGLTINGGVIEASAQSGYSIYAYPSLTVNGGTMKLKESDLGNPVTVSNDVKFKGLLAEGYAYWQEVDETGSFLKLADLENATTLNAANTNYYIKACEHTTTSGVCEYCGKDFNPAPTPSTPSGGSSSNTTSITVKNPDGSTTTTVTNKATGTVTETTKNTDGSTTTIETRKDGTVTETNKTATGTTSTTITDKNGNSTTTVSVSKKDAQSGNTVTLPVDEVTAAGKSEDAQEITVEVPAGGATVEIPVKNPTPGTVIVIVDEDGNETVVPTTKQTENGVSVTLTENATIKVIENSKDFSDVRSSDYFDKAVDWASSRGITGGTSATTFGPHESCTRAQLVTFLWRAAGQPKASGDSGMTDVSKGSYYAQAVAWAFENGIVGGYGNGLFGSEDTITREQMAVILYRFAQHTGMDTTQGGMSVREYKDYDSISDYAVTAIQWAVNAGIMQGNDGNLMPGQPCTRAQIVTMLYRLLGE